MTLQLAAGFTLTVATIWLVPILVAGLGWRWAFLVLVPGPAIGTWAMRTLARNPDGQRPADPRPVRHARRSAVLETVVTAARALARAR